MAVAISADGTAIAYDIFGEGPPILLVDGALAYRAHHGCRPLAAALADAFRVVVYDRRGRGESGDTLPYAVEREFEDIAALIDAVGSPVSLYGFSSGAVLALRAAEHLESRIAKLALHAPPLSAGDAAKTEFAAYKERMNDLLAAGQRGDAVTLFLADMLPADILEGLRHSPEWPQMEAVAPTLAYDNAIMGDGVLPVEVASAITVPTLVLDAAGSPDIMRETGDALAGATPTAQRHTIDSPVHQVPPETLAPVLRRFFAG